MTSRLEIPTENQEQRAIVKWLSYHPIVRNYYCKINNEGQRTAGQGYNLQLMGLRRGASDLLIYYPVGRFSGLWIEMKRAKEYTISERNSLTWKAQVDFQENVKRVGYVAFFAYGWVDAKNIIEKYLNDKSNIHHLGKVF